MNHKKIVFLDVDGTLVDFTMHMPQSAREALHQAKANGHLISLCTGRTATGIYPWLLDFGFDAIVASAGAYVQCGKEVIFHNVLESRRVAEMVEVIADHGACYMLQGMDGRYSDADNLKRMRKRCVKLGLDIERALNGITVIEHPELGSGIESGVYFDADIPIAALQREVGDYIKITGASFGKDREMSGEMTCMGINKATGMQRLIEHLGMSKEDTIAFGDGPNDTEMLAYAQIGVAMGNATNSVKRYADMVTEDINKDGIYLAFQKLGLI